MSASGLTLSVTKCQRSFIEASADEVLFGGAAGGGKSYGQLIDALLFALRYPGSKQLLLRRTLPELERSLLRAAMGLYPKEVYRYTAASHSGRFTNGSILEFGYCDSELDVYKYQSAEYDVLRFDELTHFTETMYTYLISRVRGVNEYPKQVKSSTNPGGVGHTWVKERFIDLGPPGKTLQAPAGTRLFLPAKIQDNLFLMEKDPGYLKRLQNLPPREKQALLYGDWDLFEGRFFTEFSRAAHVCAPFSIPAHWRRYVSLDYGTDMLAAYWIAMDENDRAYVYRELYEGRDNKKGKGGLGHIISEAAKRLLQENGLEEIELYLAPPDLWNRRQETGRSAADIFAENGILLTKTSNDRVNGWRAAREWLALQKEENGEEVPRLHIFEGCVNLIRTLPALQYDPKNPEDALGRPHELTHAPDALRGFCVYWTSAAERPRAARALWSRDMWEDYQNADPSAAAYLIKKWGEPT